MTLGFPISCGVCEPTHTTHSEQDMYFHIKDAHLDYTEEEAREFSHLWTEDAYDEMQQERELHARAHRLKACDCNEVDEVALDRSVEADRRHSVHGE